jgi:Holliday junction resolvase RusA-like endonuclease
MCIPLKLVSAKNRKIQTRSGKVFKNPEVVAFERDFGMLVPSEYRNLALGSLTSPLGAKIEVYYPSRRSDLDCALLYDCLQTAGVIANDRYIREKWEIAHIDRANPRIEIELRVLDL